MYYKLGASMRRVILVVEDEAILLMGAVSVLHDAHYDTVSASTVAEAVAIIEDPEQKLDLLFTDLGLADHKDGGWRLVRQWPGLVRGSPSSTLPHVG